MADFSQARTDGADEEAVGWPATVLEAIETLHPEAYGDLMEPDVLIRLPDGSELHGREEAVAFFRVDWAELASLVHHERNVVGTAERLVHESRVTTTSTDGGTTTADSTAWIERGPDGLISAARVYG